MGVLVVLVLVKFGVCYLVVCMVGEDNCMVLGIGVLMNLCGLMEFIIINIGL